MAQGTILIVEDEPDAGKAMSEMLQSDGFSVELAETAREALHKAHGISPDLMLIDIGLPDGNGLFLAHMLSKIHKAPVIIVTGKPSFTFDEPMGANPQIKSVVIKPCSHRILLGAVREALASQPSQGDETDEPPRNNPPDR